MYFRIMAPGATLTCKNLSSNLSFNSYDLILTQVRFCQNSVLPNSLRVAPRVLSFKEKSQKFVNYQLLFLLVYNILQIQKVVIINLREI